MQGVLCFVFCQHSAELYVNNSDHSRNNIWANLVWSTRTAARKVAYTCDPSCASRLSPTKAPFKEDGNLDLLVSPLNTVNGHEDGTGKRFRTLQLEVLEQKWQQ